eukprot:4234237-Amphidinium_carterae.1
MIAILIIVFMDQHYSKWENGIDNDNGQAISKSTWIVALTAFAGTLLVAGDGVRVADTSRRIKTMHMPFESARDLHPGFKLC